MFAAAGSLWWPTEKWRASTSAGSLSLSRNSTRGGRRGRRNGRKSGSQTIQRVGVNAWKSCSVTNGTTRFLKMCLSVCSPEAPEEEYDPRCLYDRLQEQKDKKQQEYEEQFKFRRSISSNPAWFTCIPHHEGEQLPKGSAASDPFASKYTQENNRKLSSAWLGYSYVLNLLPALFGGNVV